jgi:hypothetical protein
MNGSTLRRPVKEGGDDGDDDGGGGDEAEAELDDTDEERFGGELNKGSELLELGMSGALVCILT